MKGGSTITKRTVADRIADRFGIGQTLTLQVIQSFLDEIVEELAQGNRLEFRDFGVFETVERRPRTALNPKTLERVAVERKIVAKFKPGRLMKDRVSALAAALTEAEAAQNAAGGENLAGGEAASPSL